MELEREIQDIEVAIDKVHAAIVSYLSKLSSQELSEDHSRKALSCLALVNACEGFSDTLCHQGTELVHTRVQSRVEIHPKTKEHFDHLWKMVAQRLESVLSSMSHENSEACDEILEQKKIVVHMAEMLSERLASRLLVSEPNRIPTYRLEIELSDMIQRLDHHVKDMAKQGRQLYKLQEA
jgi:phosphate:Na+ symporter